MQTDFARFIAALSHDPRLGRYTRDLVGKEPATCVLSLAVALADAAEGKQPHPAHALLERMEATR